MGVVASKSDTSDGRSCLAACSLFQLSKVVFPSDFQVTMSNAIVPSNARTARNRLIAGAAALGAGMLGNAIHAGSRRAGEAVVERVAQQIASSSQNVGRRPRAGRQRRTNRKGQGSGRPVAAPVAFGFTVRKNYVGTPQACSFGGMRGIKLRGSQIYCDVVAGDGTTRSKLFVLHGIYEELSYASMIFRPGLAQAAAGAALYNTIAPAMQDPLVTEMSVYRMFRLTKLRFRYYPTSSTQTNGTLAFAWTPAISKSDTGLGDSSAFEDETLLQYEISTACPVWQEMVLDVTPGLHKDRLQWVNATNVQPASFLSSSVISPISATDLCCGTLAAGVDNSSNNQAFGRLVIEYEIELYYKGPHVLVDDIDSDGVRRQPKRRPLMMAHEPAPETPVLVVTEPLEFKQALPDKVGAKSTK